MVEFVNNLCTRAREAQKSLGSSLDKRGAILRSAVRIMREMKTEILAENAKDLEAAEKSGLPYSMLDRLRLTEDRLQSICQGVLDVAAQEDPLGKGTVQQLSNGLNVQRIQVPLGVICMIYEARPNVTADAAALSIMSGNVVILKGGKEAICSNIILAEAFRKAAGEHGVSPDIVQAVTNTDRGVVAELLTRRGEIDLVIPRGGRALIDHVVTHSTVPVIETGAGNCHIYVEKTADVDMAVRIVHNAKTSRPAVCNAVETVLCDREIAPAFLPALYRSLNEANVEIRGCAETLQYMDAKLATDEDYATEYNDYILAVKVVSDIGEAIAHIERYTTRHSEAIVTTSMQAAARFTGEVDAAAVYVNASTRFTDGGVFGLGAEIGISTQKLHIRGPFGLSALVTTKYVIQGDGQIRS